MDTKMRVWCLGDLGLGPRGVIEPAHDLLTNGWCTCGYCRIIQVNVGVIWVSIWRTADLLMGILHHLGSLPLPALNSLGLSGSGQRRVSSCIILWSL